MEASAGFSLRIDLNMTALYMTEEDQRFPKNIREECITTCAPEKYDSFRDTKALDAFIVSLKAYTSSRSWTEEKKSDCGIWLVGRSKVMVATSVQASSFGTWHHLRSGQRATRDGHISVSCSWGTIYGQIEEANARKLSIKNRVEKYYTLVRKSHMVVPELWCQWSMAGLSPESGN